MAYDNLPIKGYLYPLDEVKQAHDLDVWVPSAGGTVAICPPLLALSERPQDLYSYMPSMNETTTLRSFPAA